jgi:hypothetical protein
MAIFAFYPAVDAHRRADGIGFVLAEGADEAAARSATDNLIGAPGITPWTAVEVTAGLDAVAIEGMPVGARNGSTWPTRTRGNRALNA